MVNISKSLNDLVYDDVIPSNPANRVRLPKREKFIPSFYDIDELNTLLEVAQGSNIELAVMLGVYYGMRRSEICGLKWSAIDFKTKELMIKSTVVRNSTLIKEDNTKSESSQRTLPLFPPIEQYMKKLRVSQAKDKLFFGAEYNDKDYIIKWADGRPIDSNYLSHSFKKLIKKNGMRDIRFHDLRHSCAAMMISLGISLKVIQEYLGHAHFETTADIYGHLTKEIKMEAFNAINGALGLKKVVAM